jgi:hypothetical protein
MCVCVCVRPRKCSKHGEERMQPLQLAVEWAARGGYPP